MKHTGLGINLEDLNKGHAKDLLKALWNIKYEIRPMFRRHGLTIKIKAGLDAEIIRPPSKAKEWSNEEDRVKEHSTHGILSVGNPIGMPKNRIYIQPTYVASINTAYKRREPRFAIPRTIVKITTPETRIATIQEILRFNHIYYFIMTASGSFWAGKYGDIPIKYLSMDYRNDPKILDRLIVTSKWYDVNHPFTDENKVIDYLLNEMLNNENR